MIHLEQKMVTNEQFWDVLGRISKDSRSRLKQRGPRITNGSERQHIIRCEIPYNPLQIMREASRLAVEAGVKDGEMWSLDNYGACVGDGTDVYATTFFSQRRHDVDPGDADKLAALDVLARVCEYIERRNR
jgi:hypothetical protein